jgi:hypothetical protein
MDQELWARKLMSYIMSCEHILSWNDIIKFNLLFDYPIWVQ